MFIYCVTVTIVESAHDEWLDWMRSIHIPEVLRTGLLLSATIYKVHIPAQEEGPTYTIQYTCRSMDDYEQYQREHAPLLQAAHTEKFSGRFTASRTLMESLP
jgi:hypothetical protein